MKSFKIILVLSVCAVLLAVFLGIFWFAYNATHITDNDYLKYEKQMLKERDATVCSYCIQTCADNSVIYTGTYKECYDNLKGYEAFYGDCCIMPKEK